MQSILESAKNSGATAELNWRGSTRECGAIRQPAVQPRRDCHWPSGLVPLLELLPERAVECPRPGLKEEACAGLRPLHLLALAKRLAHNRIDGTLHEPGGDPLAVAPPLGIVRRVTT